MKRFILVILLAMLAISSLPANALANEEFFGSVAVDLREAERIGGQRALEAKLLQILRAAQIAYSEIQIVELLSYLIQNGFSPELIATEADAAGISAEIVTLANQVAKGLAMTTKDSESYEQLGSIYVFSDSAHVAGSRNCAYVSPWSWNCF